MPLNCFGQALGRLTLLATLLLFPATGHPQLVVEGPHPLARGRYEFRVGGKQVGFEDWKTFFTRDSFILAGNAQITEPAVKYGFRFTMGTDFSPKELDIELTLGSRKLAGTYEFSAEEAHQVVTSSQSRSERRVRMPAGYKADFGSPLFNFHALHQQSFVRGQPKMFDVVLISLPTLVASATQQTYTYLGNEPLDRKGTKVDARHFRFETSVDGQPYLAEIWTDADGMPLLIRRGSGASLEETELVQMETLPRRRVAP